VGSQFRTSTTFRSSAPHTGVEPHFWCEIDGAEPAEKKVRNGGRGTTKNNFCTSELTENYFHSNGNNVSLVLIFERLKNNNSDNKYIFSHFYSR